MNKAKENKELSGNLMRPITIGKSAIFSSGGQIFHTSRVVALHEQTTGYIHFETLNTHYHLSIQPFPLAAISPLPVRLAACA